MFKIGEEFVNNSILPVLQFFDAIQDDSFVDAMSSILNEIGYHTQYCHCIFPSDLEPWEESFEGIQFINSALDTEVIVDSSTFQKYAVIACDAYLKTYPEDRRVLTELVRQYSNRHHLSLDGFKTK